MEIRWVHDAGGFSLSATLDGAQIRVDDWSRSADPAIASVIAQIYAWMECGEAVADEHLVLVGDEPMSCLPERHAAALSLPPVADVLLELINQSTLDRDDFKISATWKRPNGQAIAAPQREGCLLRIGGREFRLPAALYRLADALDRFDSLPVTEADARLSAWAKVQSELPEEAATRIRTTSYLGGLRLYYAASLSLRLSHAGGEVMFTPVLHGSAADDEQPLLPDHYQAAFATQVPRLTRARGKYALGDGQYAILSPPLTQALEIVRQASTADPKTRADFARNPREALRAALGDSFEESFIETLFIETTDYSARVKEIGLWQAKVLPWVSVPKEPWLPPERGGLMVGDQKIELSEGQAKTLLGQVEQARAEGKGEISHDGTSIPATQDTVDALTDLVAELAPRAEEQPGPAEDSEDTAQQSVQKAGRHVLIITDNLDDVGYETAFKRRNPEIGCTVPTSLVTSLKPHQTEGLDWLQRAWQTGRSGVLLADDMGLGKTLQALTFLVWLKEAMSRGEIRKAPFLIVAPTGLLANWVQEHDRHLDQIGLGECLRAYGSELKQIRARSGNELGIGTGVLDESKIAAADWVLTTYETARDYQLSFGRVPFAVAIFDEVQKIKTPGTLVTEAAKALRADFIIAMTGTPIENRLADLWCITDTVQPGYLGDLKSFSARYEKDPEAGTYQQLKDRMRRAPANLPPILLRRMKEERLEGLPLKTERILERAMPEAQATAYREAVAAGRAAKEKRNILNTIQELRSVSLHPFSVDNVGLSDADFIAASARYSILCDLLDDISAKNEKALIFLEFLKDQAYLAGLIQRRYQLSEAPMLINGDVGGDRRLQRVNAFQSDDRGFQAMILSPRAGGVGLTLTAANHVIHLSRWWNPAVEDQCTDRVYRIGQDKPITVYYPMALLPGAEAYSFDRRLHELLMRKRALSREMLCPPAASAADAEKLFADTIHGEAAAA